MSDWSSDVCSSRQIAEQGVILGGLIMANSLKTAQFLVESRLRDAARGDSNACFDLGIFYSTGTGGESIDLVEAHKWFNLAAVHGSERSEEHTSELQSLMRITYAVSCLK